MNVVLTNRVDPLGDAWYKYQGHVWPWPASNISWETSQSDQKKPNEDVFRDTILERVDESRPDWKSEMDTYRERLRNRGLLKTSRSTIMSTNGSNGINMIDDGIL